MSSILDQDLATFETHRRALTAPAYRMLASRAEAEDIAQDARLPRHARGRTAHEEPRRRHGALVPPRDRGAAPLCRRRGDAPVSRSDEVGARAPRTLRRPMVARAGGG